MREIKLEDLKKLKKHFAEAVQYENPEGELLNDNPALIICRNEFYVHIEYRSDFFGTVEELISLFKDETGSDEYVLKISEQSGQVYFYDKTGEILVYEIMCLKNGIDKELAFSMDINKALGPKYQMFQKLEE